MTLRAAFVVGLLSLVGCGNAVRTQELRDLSFVRVSGEFDCPNPLPADFDGDGRTDLYCSDWRSSHSFVRFNVGQGSFDALLVTPSHEEHKVLDVNGDGLADLLRVDRDGLHVVLGQPDRTLLALQPETPPVDMTNGAAADVTGDGAQQYVAYTRGQAIAVRFDSNGNVAGTDVLFAASPLPTISDIWIDVDKDARADLITALHGTLSVRRAANGWEPETIADGASWFVQIATGDFDGDGRRDIAAVLADGPNRVHVFRNTGSGFADVARLETRSPATRVVVVNVDGDGSDDLVFDGFVRRGGAGLAFDTAWTLPYSPASKVFVDVDGDKRVDLLEVVADRVNVYLQR